MKCVLLRALVISSLFLLIPISSYAQEAVLTGTITDSTGAVLPGVTVTGEAPLIETQSSELAGNIDPRQVQDLPSLGRNWMTSTTFLQPQPSANLSYDPRTVQLGFRLTF
jgi:hypothetical protein